MRPRRIIFLLSPFSSAPLIGDVINTSDSTMFFASLCICIVRMLRARSAAASALAVRAKDLIRAFRNRYRASQTHLVLYAPATFCLFLGQRLNALGRIVTYERTVEGGYQASLTISTG